MKTYKEKSVKIMEEQHSWFKKQARYLNVNMGDLIAVALDCFRGSNEIEKLKNKKSDDSAVQTKFMERLNEI